MKVLDNVKECIKNIGVYQPGRPSDEILNTIDKKTLIKLASNENPLGTSKQVLAVLNKANNLQIYPDGNAGLLKQALSNFYNINENRFILGNGSEEIIDMIIQIVVEPGDEVIFADPSFIKYDLSVKKFSGVSVRVGLDSEYKHNLDIMLASITSKTKVIFICNPNNPTGTMVDKEELRIFISRVRKDIIIVLDEAYYEYIDKNKDPGLMELNYENVIVLRTFSKAYGLAGLRIGYGIAHPQIISMLNRVKNPFNTNSLAQLAAEHALKDQEFVKDSINTNLVGKTYFYQELDKIGYQYIPTETNFIMIKVNDSQKVFNEMLKSGIIIRPGDKLGMPNWIRVTISRAEDNHRVIKVLKQIKEME